MHSAGDLDMCLDEFNGHVGRHIYIDIYIYIDSMVFIEGMV